ncbi:integrin alpha-M-like isoform X2 [Myxocyprinus asiaticus]|uniref:integrin alpha-M-like isoform X2 n=1 Tax=Myxocyprinus asiaticus TaxID=70543 RepID=UPI0022226518|nr:integrin alpha-M-like isoform X2 [Myxocyprinus asiaticus]
MITDIRCCITSLKLQNFQLPQIVIFLKVALTKVIHLSLCSVLLLNMSIYLSKSGESKACWISRLKQVTFLDMFFGFLLLADHSWGFSIETLRPRVFTAPVKGSHFGHKVCHFGPTQEDSVLVTAPLLDNGTGGIYRCSYSGHQCSQLPVKVDPGIAFGLSLACDAHQAIACGPRLMHKCEGFNYLNGQCVEISPHLSVADTLKPAFQECHVIPPLDAVILFDDSGSISDEDFKMMIKFIKNLIGLFLDTKAQVAVAKFSTRVSAVFHFENFAVNPDPDELMKYVTQAKGDTHTPSAIRFVLDQMFSEKVGMRNNSQKLLLVITDGKSNDNETFENVIPIAIERGVKRFALGVGKAYSLSELEKIASSPQFVFETVSFSALISILSQLREKIFSIEGTDTGNFSSFQMELSQGGLSVALSKGLKLFGAVGAYSWSGGIVQDLTHQLINSSFINATKTEEDIRDSYLGYSVAVATVNGDVVYFAGAPRHRHKGLVLGFTQNHQNHGWTVSHRIYGSQLGSYFGAELCVLSVSGLLAVGAPLFYAHGVGGEVRICPLNTETLNCSMFLRGAVGNDFGQFGASLAALQDLNGDSLEELAVGAPQEEKGNGAIYIFLGRPGGIRKEYSQRVSGSAVGRGLQYFGVSVHSAGDLTADSLTDVVVGSRGAVTVLRTQPVMCLPINVTVDPPIIPQKFFHCSAPLGLNSSVATLTICVTLKEVIKCNIQDPLTAVVSVALKLDSQLRAPRLLFGPRSASFFWTPSSNLTTTSPVCTTLSISIPECISDYHEVPLSIRMNVTGKLIPGTGGLRPVLSPDCHPTFTGMVLLEKVCGEDHVCVSDLNVSLSFVSDTVVSTAGYPVNLLVELTNNGEDSTDTELFLQHPTILSFTRVKASSGQVLCVSNQTELSNLTRTTCRLARTFRQRAKTTLLMSFIVSTPVAVNKRLVVNALVKSKNENNDTTQDNLATASVVVKLPINVVVRDGGSTRFVRYPHSTQLEHEYMVENNGQLSVPVNISFVLLEKLGLGFSWSLTLPEINGTGVNCEKQGLPKNVKSSNMISHCDVSTCHVIGCTIHLLTRDTPINFVFTGNISSGKQVRGLQVSIRSWGFLLFDSEQFIQYPPDDSQQLSIVTELEVPSQALAVLIASLSVSFGLIALAIVFVVLYKGFFKKSSPDDLHNLVVTSSGEHELNTVNGDQTTTQVPAESAGASATSNGGAEQITAEKPVL